MTISANTKTHYETLGISNTASVTEIKTAYRSKLLSTHPDKTVKNKTNASNIIPQLKEAYSILSDDTRRKEYDEDLEQSFKKLGFIASGDGLDNVTLDDFTFYEEDEMGWFKKNCPRCHAVESFVMNENDLEGHGTEDGVGGLEILVQCGDCSLWLKVHYYDLDEEDDQASQHTSN
ncbi:hypothetical protein WICPIJ_008253 [Wickerhamomyces pijperi]|uniref:Diphthamide biosynthesis protein 4 n=1 Tax=Wickerhamomyces pijperi TaxID=599730 RepID=A0A9P8TJE3_WICPI|nr:hypothetical protein WICPIJ_008253 [Wickerhamomyces pijperi]